LFIGDVSGGAPCGGHVLIVDDEVNMQVVLAEAFEDEGHRVSTASSGAEAISAIGAYDFDLLILDLKLPDMTGIDVFRVAREIRPGIVAIMITAYSSIDTAIEAMKMGAYDYITKPFNVEKLLMVAGNAIEGRILSAPRLSHFAELAVEDEEFGGVVGSSLKMRQLLDICRSIAPTNATVLIYGESGTGKELVASYIHKKSLRSSKPFIRVNCAAIPETLLESELFGHEKGAFTHAISRRLGRFELAHTGTIFLDEVGEMSPAMQAKLLRVLQEKEFERVGGVDTIKVDVRVVAATNQKLKQAVAEGAFREDLYYRLSVVPLFLPPLRERKQDIPALVSRFIHKYSQEFGRSVSGITHEALEHLAAHNWPGNIRELENALERAVLLARGDGLTSAGFHLGAEPMHVIPFGLGSQLLADSVLRDQGEPGYAGEEGDAREAGNNREAGEARDAGDTGSAGNAGNAGNTGSAGDASDMGDVDDTGDDGEIDVPGDAYGFDNDDQQGAMSLEELERRYIEQVLEQCGDNRTHAARILKITRRTLLNKIKKYDL